MRGTFRTIFVLAAGAAIVAALAVRPASPQRAPAVVEPAALRPAAPVEGQRIDLAGLAGMVSIGDGAAPTFLHFYNPDCPCAEESLGRLAALVDSNRDGARFAVVVEASAGNLALAQRQVEALGLSVIADHGGRIAAACGVTTTPEAVIFDAQGRLHFRGAYGYEMPAPGAASGALAVAAPADPYACPPDTATAAAPGDEP